MKLLFDQNLSHRLVEQLADLFPGSTHVRHVDLATAVDSVVWQYAAKHGLTIVSKDSDFHQRAFLMGHPPKVIWVRLGNCTTTEVGDLLRRRVEDVHRFGADDDAAFLALS